MYASLKIDQKKFDQQISPHLEPQLIATAERLFKKLDGVEIALNHQWSNGECDMLIFREVENTVLHIQAKAALPPEGARMTERLEGRIREAIDQLKQFSELSSEKQDRIVSSAFQRNLKNVRVVNAVLGWSSFGTSNTWQLLSNIAPLNIALLANLVTRDPALKLISLVESTYALVNEIIAAAEVSWEEATLEFPVGTVKFPNLNFSDAGLSEYRRQTHKAFT